MLYDLYDIDRKEILGGMQYDELKFHLKKQNLEFDFFLWMDLDLENFISQRTLFHIIFNSYLKFTYQYINKPSFGFLHRKCIKKLILAINREFSFKWFFIQNRLFSILLTSFVDIAERTV